ncbi:BppU family phage baseplate upper protein [Brochothrix thermosphacta]|uniref:BppU family phage baseplate upper protein n=1 Tax=Brochothrix thermosphacta TaxID=2756 RepID=UPI0039B00360
MSITKISKSVMEVTAEYQKLSDLNVAFYNQDINTAILQFNVTRNDAPVPLGKSNVDGYIVLLHEDGSRIQDNLVIEDEEHGVIQYTIPGEFLKHTGKVLGQVYIAVKGREDTAVMRKISFDIKQDLMTAFSAAVKLEYIKTFDDLQTQIKQRVEAIEEAIANGEDYVAQMIETLDTGKKEIDATVSKANTDINKVATDANNSVTAAADTATKDIASKATKATTDIDKAVSDGQKKITDTSNTAVATVTAKAKEVTDTIVNNQVVKITDVVNYQKQKVTADDGASLTLSQYDLLNAEDTKNFDGYVTSASNAPTSLSSGFFKRKIRTGYIEVFFSPYSENSMYRNAYHFGNKKWFGWEKIVNKSDLDKLISDTGWISYSTVNGVLANTAFKESGENGYNCAYRKITSNGIARLLLRVNISNITTESAIFANLPNNIVVNSQTGVARTNGANQKTVVTLRPSGDLSINVPSGFTANAYVYQQFDWTL